MYLMCIVQRFMWQWAGSFADLLLDEARTDCPMHLPSAPLPTLPWRPVPPAERRRMARLEGGGPRPRHCSAREAGTCPTEVDQKQTNAIATLARLTHSRAPATEELSWVTANAWIVARWEQYMRAP